MAYTFAHASFHISGTITSRVLRESLSLIECKYNLSTALSIDWSRSDWEFVAYQFELIPDLLDQRPKRFRAPGQRSSYGVSPIENNIGLLADYFASIVGGIELELKIHNVAETGSVTVDTSGMGEPLKELISKVWSKKEREESLRHTYEMNWREERAKDQEFHHREQKHILDSMVTINELVKSGALSPENAKTLIAQIMPVEEVINRQLEESAIEYVDDSLESEA